MLDAIALTLLAQKVDYVLPVEFHAVFLSRPAPLETSLVKDSQAATPPAA